ncbi:MAG: hypothetical protein E7220_01595 [Clostridiales bacterium]|nr:hypothetical protein [Clostridiales bacterium]
MKKILSLLMVLMLVFAFTACGSSEEAETEDSGQNPVMNFIGNYVCDRASILISAEGANGASVLVNWASSATENSTWVMSGEFDTDKLQIYYQDCVRTDYVYNEAGEIESSTEVFTGGHGFITFSEGSSLSLTWQEDQEHVADDMVFEFSNDVPEDEPMANMVNPWQTADSLAEATEGAGLDGFTIPEGAEISLGTVTPDEYRYMDGMVDVRIPIAAVEMTIRKGKAEVLVEEDDISGDYGEYKYEWTQTIDGQEVKCFGNREGEATKTIWSSGEDYYALLARGAGGDDDFGLSSDDLAVLVSGIK